MKRHISTGRLGMELGMRVALLAAVGVAVGHSAPTGGGTASASTGLRYFLLEHVTAYAGRVHDAVSMIVTLPLF